MAELAQRLEKPTQQVVQTLRLELGVKEAVERLGFGLAHLVVRVVQSQDDAELQLGASPSEILVFIRIRKHEDRVEDAVIFAERAHDAGRRHIELCQAASAVLDQLEEVVGGTALREDTSRSAGCNIAQRFDLPGVKPALAQAGS